MSLEHDFLYSFSSSYAPCLFFLFCVFSLLAAPRHNRAHTAMLPLRTDPTISSTSNWAFPTRAARACQAPGFGDQRKAMLQDLAGPSDCATCRMLERSDLAGSQPARDLSQKPQAVLCGAEMVSEAQLLVYCMAESFQRRMPDGSWTKLLMSTGWAQLSPRRNTTVLQRKGRY